MKRLMKKGAALLAAVTIATTIVAPQASAASFKDIGGYSATTQAQINMLAQMGIVKGTTPTTFSPAVEMSRGQVVKLLGRFLIENGLAKVPSDWKTKQRFKDVSTGAKDQELLMYGSVVYDKGIFVGSNGYLMTSDSLTRENMALLMDRTAKVLTGKSFVDMHKAEGTKHQVNDLSSAKAEAREAIAAMNALGVSTVAKYKPKTHLQRVHLVTFLSNALDVAMKYR